MNRVCLFSLIPRPLPVIQHGNGLGMKLLFVHKSTNSGMLQLGMHAGRECMGTVIIILLLSIFTVTYNQEPMSTQRVRFMAPGTTIMVKTGGYSWITLRLFGVTIVSLLLMITTVTVTTANPDRETFYLPDQFLR